MMKNKYSNFLIADKIKRFRGIYPTRLNKIRLDANERVTEFESKFLNLFKKKIKSQHLTAYPEVEEIYDLIAKFNHLKRENIMITAGSDICIRHCFELFSRPKKKVITLNPTFGMYDVYCKIFKVKQIKIDYDLKLNLDFKKLLGSIDKNTCLIMIPNPNSPTGTIIPKKKIFKILQKAKSNNVYVVIDEAYFGFYKNTFVKFLRNFNNLIITRTFSKALGMAGIRVGFLISCEKNIKRLYSFRPMYEISSISCLAVKTLLKNYKIVKKYIQETNQGKRYLLDQLKKLNLRSFETYTNFILVDFKNEKICSKVFKKLSEKGILTRKAPSIPACKNSLRFTLGPKKIMKLLVKNLKNTVQKLNISVL